MLQWRNTATRYGLVTVSLHWLVAITVPGLFALGWWMTELDYYDSWYKLGPWWHKSIGVLLFLAVIFRLIWRFFSSPPQPLASHKTWEVGVAHRVHLLLYGLMFITMLSGYLISTADNRAIEVFNWFTVPATITSIPEQEDVAGWVHIALAISLIGLALLHAAAALKHHFIDRDNTLRRMLGR